MPPAATMWTTLRIRRSVMMDHSVRTVRVDVSYERNAVGQMRELRAG